MIKVTLSSLSCLLSFCQVLILRTLNTMPATTRQHREGTLIYVKENRELYMRIDDGVRQVMVFTKIFTISTLLHIYLIPSILFYNIIFVIELKSYSKQVV